MAPTVTIRRNRPLRPCWRFTPVRRYSTVGFRLVTPWGSIRAEIR